MGLLRSLVFQLLQQSPPSCERFIAIFLNKQTMFGKAEWSTGELKSFLSDEIRKIQSQSVMLFADALDECVESEVREVVSFLEALSLTKTHVQICLSSRHYPNISMKRQREIVIDIANGHNDDIVIYVKDKLINTNLAAQLINKANGIFMWVILVVEMLNIAYSEGDIEAMQKRLNEIPSKLDDLFRSLFKSQGEDPRTILLLQWVLFAQKPIKPKELYLAVACGSPTHDLGNWNNQEIDDATVQNFLKKLSKGLVEFRKPQYATDFSVQFIHESVKDFLLRNKRLQDLDPSLGPNIITSSHKALAYCCLSYFDIPQIQSLSTECTYNQLSRDFPFLSYVVKNLFWHVENAQNNDSLNIQVSNFSQDAKKLECLVRFHDILAQPRFMPRFMPLYGFGAPLLSIVVQEDCKSMINHILSTKADINAKGGFFGNALQAAVFRDSNNEALVKLLLAAGADVNAQGGYYGSALQAAAAAAAHGHSNNEALVKLLLTAGADVNAQGGYYGSALQAAAFEGSKNEALVNLLLAAGADVNAQGGYYGNALQAAAVRGSDSETLVKLLLAAGANAKAQGGYFGGALQAAVHIGSNSEALVKLLLTAGADVNALGGHYGNALQEAVASGSDNNVAVVKLLLAAGADVNIQGGSYGNALQAAACCSSNSEALVKLLLAAGADVNAQGGNYGSALQAAAASRAGSNEALVKLLLAAGADVNAQGGYYGNALQAAVKGGSFGKTTVKLLLAAGADFNDQGGQYDNAVSRIHERVNKLLLDHGAERTEDTLKAT
jgi:ankyrin repeat protein